MRLCNEKRFHQMLSGLTGWQMTTTSSYRYFWQSLADAKLMNAVRPESVFIWSHSLTNFRFKIVPSLKFQLRLTMALDYQSMAIFLIGWRKCLVCPCHLSTCQPESTWWNSFFVKTSQLFDCLGQYPSIVRCRIQLAYALLRHRKSVIIVSINWSSFTVCQR